MKVYLRLSLSVFLLFLSLPLMSVEINHDEDFQIWVNTSTEARLSKRTNFLFETQYRFGDDASFLYYYHLQGMVLYALSNRLEIGPGYRHNFLSTPDGAERFQTYNPFVEAILNVTFLKWSIVETNRVQYAIASKSFIRNHWLYRNQLKLISPWKWGKMKFNPFLFDEVFFREYRGFFENRFGIGGFFLIRKSTVSIQYMFKFQKNDECWNHQNVLWFMFNVPF